MKKQFRTLAVLSAAALMTAAAPALGVTIPGLAQTALAASAGWTTLDGELRYQDSDGYYITDTWKKKDGDWYYLDEDGRIAKSVLVDEYYVDENGKRVSYRWVGIDNEDEWDDEAPETWWYYFGKDGKAATSEWQVIDGHYYYFDDESHMQTGKLELDGYIYYLGEEGDGVRKTGWVELENENEDYDEDTVWHYFDSKGRMIMDEVDRKIDGNYYTFEDGILQTGWYKLPQDASATDSDAEAASILPIESWQYYEDDGKRASGWYEIEGAPDVSEDDEEYRFYFKNGKAYHAETGIQVFAIDSKRYGFNVRGEMQTDLQVVTLEDGSFANYYFGDDGIMKTGKQVIYNEDLGENQTWFFYTDGSSKGQGYHGVRDNNVYRQGLRLDADRDLRYAPVELDGVTYLVNASGTIQKAGSSSKSSEKPELGKGYKDIKDANDRIWTVDTNGIVQP